VVCMGGGECIQLFGRETCRKEILWRRIELKWILQKYAGGHGLALSCQGKGQLMGLCGWCLTFEFCKYMEFRLVDRGTICSARRTLLCEVTEVPFSTCLQFVRNAACVYLVGISLVHCKEPRKQIKKGESVCVLYDFSSHS